MLGAELVRGRVTRTPWATRNADCQRLKQYWESIYCIYKPNTVPILVRPAAYWLTVFCSQVELVFHLVTGKPIMGVIFLERRNSNNNSIRRSIDFAIVKTLFGVMMCHFPIMTFEFCPSNYHVLEQAHIPSKYVAHVNGSYRLSSLFSPRSALALYRQILHLRDHW